VEQKKWERMQLRMTPEMAEEVRRHAAEEHRDYQDELRHLISLGLQQKREAKVERKPVKCSRAPSCDVELTSPQHDAVWIQKQ
jgi:hypothetical protein